jgi:hypothetical protein
MCLDEYMFNMVLAHSTPPYMFNMFNMVFYSAEQHTAVSDSAEHSELQCRTQWITVPNTVNYSAEQHMHIITVPNTVNYSAKHSELQCRIAHADHNSAEHSGLQCRTQ